MKIFTIKAKQTIPISIEEAWDFFSNPNNLPKITPPWLNLKVTSELPDAMYEGMIITYKVYPFLGIPSNWVTEITTVKEKSFFIDEQRFGPYKFWHHQHHFKEINNGVEMTDIVSYALPFDPFSRSFNNILVGKKVKGIFEFRKEVLNKFFNGNSPNLFK
ncbi:MAG: SRPBCC family protein [Ignavibacteria bacterium]|nr:SRPBCC family protein [Bacteroidia bacterium]MBT8386369.1 SRPBCC family protein [Ignavibacteria bacterium]